jgi:hypothetical protein
MRILVHGLQSSGASLFTLFLAQHPNRIAIIDLLNKQLAPSLIHLKDKEVLLKTVVTSKYTLQDHQENYNPDKTILFIRNPYDNYVSLMAKKWKNENGSINVKFKLIEKYFCSNVFDLIMFYEDLICAKTQTIEKLNSNGIVADIFYYDFNRSFQSIFEFNKMNNIFEEDKFKYNTGQIHFNRKNIINPKLMRKNISEQDKEMVQKLCPTICEHYKHQKK